MLKSLLKENAALPGVITTPGEFSNLSRIPQQISEIFVHRQNQVMRPFSFDA